MLSRFELRPQHARTLGDDVDDPVLEIPAVRPLGLARSAPGLGALFAIFRRSDRSAHTRELGAAGGARRRVELRVFAMAWCDYWLFLLRARLAIAGFKINDKPFAFAQSDLVPRARTTCGFLRLPQPRGCRPSPPGVCRSRRRCARERGRAHCPTARARCACLTAPRQVPGAAHARRRGALVPGRERSPRCVRMGVARRARRSRPGGAAAQAASGARLRDAIAALCDGAAPRAASIAIVFANSATARSPVSRCACPLIVDVPQRR